MRATMLYLLVIMVCLTLSWPANLAPATAAPAVSQDVDVHEEDFTSHTYKEYTDPTVDWDVFGHSLSLAPMSGRYQELPAVAPDGHGGIYVVWEEIRGTGKEWDIYAQRVDEEGNRMWSEDIRVHHSNSYSQMKPALAVDTDGNAIVVWHDDRERHAGGQGAVYAQKLSLTGERLWAEDRRINGAPSYLEEWNARQIAIATDNDNNAVVVWQGNRDDKTDLEIYAQKVDPSGNRQWTTDIQVSDDDGSATPQRVPDVAVDALGNAVIVWVDGRHGGEDIYAQRLDSNGNHLWENDVPVSDGISVEHQGNVSLDVDSQGNAIVVWQYGALRDPLADGAVYAQRISKTGQRSWGSSVRVNQNVNRCSRDWPSVAITASGTAVVLWAAYVPDNNLYMQRLGPDGIVEWAADRALIASWGEYYVGRVRLDRIDRAHLVWHEWYLSASHDIFLQQVDTVTGKLLWPGRAVRVERGAGSTTQVYPDVVAAPDGQATVVWGDFRRGDWAVHGLRIDADGNAVWPTSYLVNLDPTTQGWMPAADSDVSGDVMVVWQGASGVVAQRINTDGNRQWPTDLVVREAGAWYQDPDIVATLDRTFYVVWLQQRPDTDEELWDVHAQRISASGQRIWSTDQRVNRQDYTVPANSPVRPFEPVVAVDDEGYLIVAWYGKTDTDADIYLQRLSPQGNPIWSQDVALNARLPMPGMGDADLWTTNTAVALAADTDIFVVWVDNRNGDLDIFMQKADKSGNLLWTSAKRANGDTGTANQRSPVITLASDGNLVLVWNDDRNGLQDVYAQRFTPGGTPAWGADVKVNRIADIWACDPNVSRQSLDHFLIVWRSRAVRGDEDVYVQRLGADGTVQWATDVCLTAGGHYYYPSGIARSKTVDTTPDGILRATLTADMETHGGEAQFYLTNDGGAHWAPITPGVTHVFTTTGSDLRWQVELATSPSWADNAVKIEKLRIEYWTSPNEGDDYEPDDTCAQASPVQVNGAVQTHNFHQPQDEDWAWFDVVSGTTYVLQTAHAGPRADTVLELYDLCAHPILTDTNDFGQDARLVFTAPSTATLYARVSNLDRSVYGAGTNYDFSVRTYHPSGLAVLVAGHNDAWQLQPNINYATDRAYRILLDAAFPKASVRYLGPDSNRDADENGLTDDIVTTATITNVRYAIQNWPREQGLSSGVPLFIYLMDHGHYDKFLANGSADAVTAEMLDLWLSNLETTTGADQITVIIDACKSGSFIDVTSDGPAEIAAPNRVIVASTTSRRNAFPSKHGSLFSDSFWTALGGNQDVWSAFQTAKTAISSRGLAQTPWLDDNGDALADEKDGDLARGRGLAGVFGGSEPVIDWLRVGEVTASGAVTVTAQVRDDFAVTDVYVEVFPPGYEEPDAAPGEAPMVNVPTATLTLAGGDLYTATLTNLTPPGLYRVVAYAMDDEDNWAPPAWEAVRSGWAVYLPLVMRSD